MNYATEQHLVIKVSCASITLP